MIDDGKTLPPIQRAKKNPGGSGTAKRIRLAPRDLEQIEKMAAIGLPLGQIAWLIGISETTLDRLLKKDREAVELGKAKPDNAWAIFLRGRARGDAELAKVCFEVATKDKNASMLQFLAKCRLRWTEPAQEHKVEQTVIFETQVGKDGVIRQQQLDAFQDGGHVIELPTAQGSKK